MMTHFQSSTNGFGCQHRRRWWWHTSFLRVSLTLILTLTGGWFNTIHAAAAAANANSININNNNSRDAKCPPPEEIMPCRCRGWNSQIQVWCSHSDLERVNGALEHLMKLRTMPAIDELIVENNRMPALPARAFGALRIGRLLLRNNGLESISRNAFAGLEDFLEELYIVETKLIDFPYDSIENLKNLEAFTIEKSKIRLLPKFSGLNRLKHIRIDGSLISSLPIGAFAKMGSIKQLHLVNSQLGRIAEGIFGPLDTLMLANFSGNHIESIQRRSFALLPKLEVLSLANNKLSDSVSIGRAVEVLSSLKSLDISNNQLKTLEEGSFVNLKSLQMLHIVANQIQTVSPKSFTHLPALRKVDLSTNELRNFPRQFFESTPLLEELRLRRNLLSTPGEISQLLHSLKSIRFLDLGENGISTLQAGTFTNHTQIQRLDLSDNVISSIGLNSFVNVPTLMELSLRNNSLTRLPFSTSSASAKPSGDSWSIPSLIELDLSANKLQALDSSTFDGFDHLTRIDLSFNSLKSIPSSSFSLNKNIEYLDLMGNGLQHLAADALIGLKKLNKLDLSRNHLESLDGSLFSNMRHLQYLNLGHNRLNNLPAHLFSQLSGLEELNLRSNLLGNFLPRSLLNGLGNLKELNLNHNSLADLGSGLLAGLRKLETLKLGANQIISLSDDLFAETTALKSIDLNNNRIKELSMKSLANLPELEKFEARENRISSLSKDVFANSGKLQILDLAHNALSQIPANVRSIGSLKVLDLSHNQIGELLPVDIFKRLGNLMELYLNDNRLQVISPHTFSNLESLTIVDLDGNELGEIKSDTFYNLPRLIYLRLSRNKLKLIQNKAFATLQSLDGLDLQENELESVGELAFDKTGSLKYLNLSHNNFDGMSRMGLFSLQSLEVLDMSFNRISLVDEKSLRHLKWLVELRISDNGICRLPVGVFDGMSRLKMLILKNNFLTHIYESVFFKLKNNIAFIDISGNPIACDCELAWLRTLMSRESIQELTDSTCESPNDLKGSPLRSVRLARMVCTSAAEHTNNLRSSRGGRGFGDEECPVLEVSKRKPRPLLASQSRQPTERPLFGSNPSATNNVLNNGANNNNNEFSPDSGGLGEYVAATNNELKNRRKDEKYIESDDYTPGDTPTIYAGSTTTTMRKKTTSIQSGLSKSPGGSALSNLGSLLGISLPELDFGFNLGLSPSISLNEKSNKKYGSSSSSNTGRDGEEPSNSFSTNAILPRPDPLPTHWLNRPSKIDENIDELTDDDAEQLEDTSDESISNIYEPPEYIPRKPSQPYIPLNPYAETNNRAKIVQTKNKNNARGPLSTDSSFYSSRNGGSGGGGQKAGGGRPIRFPSGTATDKSSSWHPSYPNTETGFIPIEPFFHSKGTTFKKKQDNNSNNNETKSTSSSTANRPKVVYAGPGSSNNNNNNVDNNAPLLSSSSTSAPYVVRLPNVVTKKSPILMEDTDNNEGSYTPVEIKDVVDKEKENGQVDEGGGNSDDLPDFWSMFATGTNNGGGDKNKEKVPQLPAPPESEAENLLPFNFSAPIDTPLGYLDPHRNSNAAKPGLTSNVDNTEPDFGSASNPIPNEGSSRNTAANNNNNKFSTLTSFTSTISHNYSSSTSSGNSPTSSNSNGRRPPGRSTITKLPSAGGGGGGGADKSLASNIINTSSAGNDFEPDASTTSSTTGRSLIPPVLIGGGEKIQEPTDWYYTNYNTNQQQAGEELEKYLERSRVNQVEDVLIGISRPPPPPPPRPLQPPINTRKGPPGTSSPSSSSSSSSASSSISTLKLSTSHKYFSSSSNTSYLLLLLLLTTTSAFTNYYSCQQISLFR